MWKRIWKEEFIRDVNNRLDFLIENNKISNEVSFTENKVLEYEKLDKSNIESETDSFQNFPEWRDIEKIHKLKERNRKLVEIAKREFERKNNWKLFCEVCNFDFNMFYWKNYIEAHHKIPLFEIEDRSGNTIKDLAMLCANCHRMIHFCDPKGQCH
jgi:predicted HNH restriction endonuclease